MPSSKHFSESEQRFRKKWLIFSLIIYGLCPVIGVDWLSLSTLSENPLPLFVVGINGIQLFLLYYFTYKKAGTRFLTFLTSMKCLGLLKAMTPPFPNLGEEFMLEWIATFITFSLTLAWIILSFRLRGIQKKDIPSEKQVA